MLKSLFARLVALLENTPAVLLYGLAAIVPPILAAAGVPKATAGAVAAGLTAVASIITAVKARPVALPVIMGGAATLLSVFTTFGLHLTPDMTAAILSGLNMVLAFAFHLALIPVVSTRPIDGAARGRSVADVVVNVRANTTQLAATLEAIGRAVRDASIT